MTLPILLFQGATHGNFLTRCCHVASGEIEDFDFYGSNYGAHKSIGSKRIIDDIHPHDLSLSDENNIFVYISIDHSDLYILLWHWMLASGELGIDVLTIKDFADIEKVLNKKTKYAPPIKNNIKKQVDIYNKSGVSSGYSQYSYDVRGATQNNVVYPSKDPSIFEVKYPNSDIRGSITNF